MHLGKILLSLSPGIFGVAAWFYINPAGKIGLTEEELRKKYHIEYQSGKKDGSVMMRQIKKAAGKEDKEEK